MHAIARLFFCASLTWAGDAYRLANINGRGYSSQPEFIGKLGDQLIFRAHTPVRGLWITDGLTTEYLAPIASSYIKTLGEVNHKFYFANHDSSTGTELWVTDGTEANTFAIDIVQGSGSSSPSDGVEFGGRLYFTAYDSGGYWVWSTDGTLAGTRIESTVKVANLYGDDLLHKVNGRLIFLGDTNESGREWWSIDVDGNESLVADIFPGHGNGVADIGHSNDGWIFFTGTDGVHGKEPWRTNGLTVETQMIQDFSPGIADSLVGRSFDLPDSGFAFNVRVDGDWHAYQWHPTSQILIPLGLPNELVIGEMVALPERMVIFENGRVKAFDYLGNKTLDNVNYQGTELVNWNDLAYFRGRDRELWVTNGTPGGTHQVADINLLGYSDPGQFTPTTLGLVFFATELEHGREPYISDGTTSGTYRLKDVYPGAADSTDQSFITQCGSHLVMRLNSRFTSTELFRSEGLPESVELVQDLYPGSQGSEHNNFCFVDNQFYFLAHDELNYYHDAWVSDGTSSGTHKIATSFNIEQPTNNNDTTVFDDKYYLQGKTGSYSSHVYAIDNYGFESLIGNAGLLFANDDSLYIHAQGNWYRSDGTSEGTQLVHTYSGSRQKGWGVGAFGVITTFQSGFGSEPTIDHMGITETFDLNPGPGSSNMTVPIQLDDTLFFVADDGSGAQLFAFDGMTAPLPIVSINANTSATRLFNLGPELFIIHSSGPPSEILVSDGTTNGTMTIWSNPQWSQTGGVSNGTYYFGVADELWQSDGTSANTQFLSAIPLYTSGVQPSIVSDGRYIVFKTGANDLGVYDTWNEVSFTAMSSLPGTWDSIYKVHGCLGRRFVITATDHEGVEPWMYCPGSSLAEIQTSASNWPNRPITALIVGVNDRCP